MERKYATEADTTAVAKEAIWLAYQAAGGPSGYGFFQARDSATKDDVWKCAFDAGDYPQRYAQNLDVHADYVFGRMMKLYIHRTATTIDVPDDKCRHDYQAWCGKYPTYAALFDAAEAAANVKPVDTVSA